MGKTPGRNIRHLSDEELLLLADGELAGRALEKARAHLDGCWTCRGRFDELQSTIGVITQLRNESVANAADTPTSPWLGLEARFDSADRQLTRRSRLARWRRWSPLAPGGSGLGRGGAAVAAVGLVAVWLSTSTASAAAVRSAIVRLAHYVVAAVRPQGPTPQTARDVALRPEPPAARVVKSPPVRANRVNAAPPRLTPRELIDLDIEAIARLDRADALLGEQLTVERIVDRGALRIHGVVDTAARKRDLLNALGPLASHSSVTVDLKTTTEALAAQTAVPNAPVLLQSVEIDATPRPIAEEIRRYVVSKRQGDKAGGQSNDEATIRQEIEALTTSVLTRAFQARLHARALTQAVDRYSPDEIGALSANARKTWHQIIRQHAAAFGRETSALRTTLQPVFFASDNPEVVEADVPVSHEHDLLRAGRRLFELGSYHDATLAQAFSLSVQESSPPPWRRLHQSLKTAEQLAERIAKFTTQ